MLGGCNRAHCDQQAPNEGSNRHEGRTFVECPSPGAGPANARPMRNPCPHIMATANREPATRGPRPCRPGPRHGGCQHRRDTTRWHALTPNPAHGCPYEDAYARRQPIYTTRRRLRTFLPGPRMGRAWGVPGEASKSAAHMRAQAGGASCTASPGISPTAGDLLDGLRAPERARMRASEMLTDHGSVMLLCCSS